MLTNKPDIIAELRKRFLEASKEVNRLPIGGLPFRKIETYDYDDNGMEFRIHRLKKRSINGQKIPGIWEIVELKGNSNYEPHIHDRTDATFHIMAGSGVIVIGNDYRHYNTGSDYDAPKGRPHGYITNEPTVFLSVQDRPIKDPATGELDFRRIENPWRPPRWAMEQHLRNQKNAKAAATA